MSLEEKTVVGIKTNVTRFVKRIFHKFHTLDSINFKDCNFVIKRYTKLKVAPAIEPDGASC